MRRWLFLAVIAYGAWHGWQGREQKQAPGQVAPHEPIQAALTSRPELHKPGFTISPLASFDIEARVLSRENYHLDEGAKLSPIDLALGWGIMSDSDVLQHISISQNSRFYFWSAKELPASVEEIAQHSANMHLIPANDTVLKHLEKIRPGQVVHLTGYLIEARRADGWHWRSSLTRNDTGAGACEVVWVDDVEIE